MEFLSSPYNHPEPYIREQRYISALKVTHDMTMKGHIIYSPIVAWHEVAKIYDMPKDFPFWKRLCLAMLEKSSKLWVLRLDGWEKSEGMACELEAAIGWNIPYEYI